MYTFLTQRWLSVCAPGVTALGVALLVWGVLLSITLGAIPNAFANTELPIATTIELSGVPAATGMVVRFDEDSRTYTPSEQQFDSAVYGVVGERPAIVFMTASNTTAVVTQGVSGVLVDAAGNGAIKRGDVLTTSAMVGTAMRADVDTMAVFAVALEDWTQGVGTVMAEVGVERAQRLQRERQAAVLAAEAVEPTETTSYVRAIMAGILTLLALGFLLYSFRSILSSGVVSVGRNPRARASVLWLSLGSMTMVVLLAAVVVFIALGVLVLPL